jgi:ribosomal protein S18 acetylase RimI-like enzyme
MSIVVGPVAGPVREAVAPILADAVGGPDKDARRSAVERLISDSVMVTALRSGAAVGAGCLSLVGRSGRLTALAVARPWRGLGIGRAVLDAAFTHLDLATMKAETDEEAVGFYRACGFSVTSLGHRYPGVERNAVFRAAASP